VNHQYSKSFEFEEQFSDLLTRHVVDGIRYFSILRPLSEVAIARRFARHPKYFPVFRSCNTAFRQAPERRGTNWCCDCPKCRFVFLALAPFVDRQQLIATFGRNVLDDTGQVDGFAELCGLRLHKPFECVGEVAESAAVMSHLGGVRGWRDDAVVRALSPQLPTGDLESLFVPRGPHLVPDRYLAMLDACG
jgi:UDP-N-acetyl-alpha-D-muramoyl-L-alanyl-L-glutamate epimerase